jgi:hypothetical protein
MKNPIYSNVIFIFGKSRNSFIQSIVPVCLICALGSIVDLMGSILIRSSVEGGFLEKYKQTKSIYLILILLMRKYLLKNLLNVHLFYFHNIIQYVMNFLLVHLLCQLELNHSQI